MMEDREGEREKTDNRNRSSSDSNDGIIKQAIKSMINMWKNLKDRMEIFAIQFGIVKKKAIWKSTKKSISKIKNVID